MAQQAFKQSLKELSAKKSHSYQIAVHMELQNMLRIAFFIAKDEKIQKLFWQGKQAVEQEGGGAGGKQAAEIRQQLLKVLLPAWEHLQQELDIRQLHFHLGPGSLSFLRVHRPEKFGDRMDDLRHIIVDTNRDHQFRTGFEIGRVYAGLRAVVPVFIQLNGQQEYIGALEVGTSFESILNVLGKELKDGVAVVLREQYVQGSMWQDMVKERFTRLSKNCACLVEATSRSNEETASVLNLAASHLIAHGNSELQTHIIDWQAYTAITHVPLYDYKQRINPASPPVGRVLFWSNITAETKALHYSLYANICLSILAYIIIEILLYVAIRLLSQRLMREIQDRTEDLRSSQQALQQANQRFKNVLDGLDAFIYVSDIETYEVLYVNRKLRESNKVETGQLCWQSIQAGQTQACHFCTNDRLIDEKGHAKATYVWEFQNTHTQAWLKCFDTAIPWGEEGRLVRLEIATDISSEKHREAELETARQAAEMANRAKSAFLANMSHELRTPLNAVLGFAQILAMDNTLSKEQLSHVQTIQNSGDYLLVLINDVLDLAKIEAGRFELCPNVWHTEEFFSTLSQIFTIRAQQKGIRLHYHAGLDMPCKLYCDEKRIRQIVMNLLGNAVKFTDHGHVTLSTAFQNEHLIIHVEDSGIGMSAAEQQHIFEPFTQAGDALHKAQGTGLGLSITQRLVELMNGSIRVESYPNKGSHFQVELPVEVVSTLDEALEPTTATQRKAIAYQREHGDAPLRLLVVEDIANNREMLRKLLEPLNFELLDAETGEVCLDRLSLLTSPPDAVLMDLFLPGIDGLETTRRIHAQTQFADLPVIAVSASVFQDSQQQALQAGCCAHISKPIRLQELLNTLEKCLPLKLLYAEVSKPTQTARVPSQTLNPTQLKMLRHLIMLGDVSSLMQYLKEQLGRAESAEQHSLQYLIELAHNFELETIEDYLNSENS